MEPNLLLKPTSNDGTQIVVETGCMSLSVQSAKLAEGTATLSSLGISCHQFIAPKNVVVEEEEGDKVVLVK